MQIAQQCDVDTNKMEEWHAAFKMFDKDQNGHISCEELMTVMRNMSQDPTEKEIQEMIAEMDENDSKQIEFHEFCKHMTRKYRNPEQKRDEIKEAFKIFDKDGNGFISAQELRTIMTSFGEHLSSEEADEMIECADINGDGKIDYEEFARMMYNV